MIASLGLGVLTLTAGRSARAQAQVPALSNCTDNTSQTVTAWFGDLRFMKQE